jgi:hypothetical protein
VRVSHLFIGQCTNGHACVVGQDVNVTAGTSVAPAAMASTTSVATLDATGGDGDDADQRSDRRIGRSGLPGDDEQGHERCQHDPDQHRCNGLTTQQQGASRSLR